MPFLTFIYRIPKVNNKTYFGKYIFFAMSDEHEGLDDEIRYDVVKAINQFRKNQGEEKIVYEDLKIGILSYSFEDYIPIYSSEREVEAFDFYLEQIDYSNEKIYMNGIRL